ncbi:aldo/keto reductase [Actinorhabdospora filicis]|uniref:Aldo/keto reductase n=1 Tax=Actinorhabdospora filicis TaxID=1785913 RepID=A0A9W6WBM0_9ACTN|nr:aldo/keto reductase family protein [Actinorhabdospora filicis]GLZ78860.1 aldo/keto reductase [Actinorhabdospora filicis]
MLFRSLGSSGLKISALTFGNWLAGADPSQLAACVRAALDAGVTTFDTADVYGNPDFGAGERALGEALAGVRRESLVIATKVALPTGDGPNDRGLSRKHVMESAEASLRRLRTDHIDLYQAHRFDPDTPLEETMSAFADLVHQGKVGYLGVSEWTAAQIEAAHALTRELRVPLVSSQPQYSMLWRVPEAEVVPTSMRLGLGQIVWSPLAQGVLAGRYPPGDGVPEGSRATTERGKLFVSRYMSRAVLEAVQRLRPIADEVGLSMAQLALAWVLHRPGVASAIMGASRPEQVAANAAAVEATLPGDVFAAVDAALVDPVHGDLVERDGAKVARAMDVMPAWRE